MNILNQYDVESLKIQKLTNDYINNVRDINSTSRVLVIIDGEICLISSSVENDLIMALGLLEMTRIRLAFQEEQEFKIRMGLQQLKNQVINSCDNGKAN